MRRSKYQPSRSVIQKIIPVYDIKYNKIITDYKISITLKICGKDDAILNLRHYIKPDDNDKLLYSMHYINNMYGNMDDIKYELSSISLNSIDLCPKYLFIHTKPCKDEYDITMIRFCNDESMMLSLLYDPDEIVFRIEMDNSIYEEFYYILNHLYIHIKTVNDNFYTSYTYRTYNIHKVGGYVELMSRLGLTKISCHVDTMESLISDIVDTIEDASIYFVTYEPMTNIINGIYEHNNQSYYPITNPNSLFISGEDLKDIYDSILKFKKEGE